MLNIKNVSIAVLLSLVSLAIGGPTAMRGLYDPTTVSYHKLRPDTKKQVDCLADNIYFEARGEGTIGQKAVAFVTMNRVVSKRFPPTVCGVVRQKTNDICQFSWWCDEEIRQRAIERRVDPHTYNQVRLVAIDVYFNYGLLHDVTKGALFFHAESVSKEAFGTAVRMTTKIGQHIFYRN